ncbi:MAG: hypothetical protein IJ012_03800 [Clostridia bacterium]|nr:hypothetical protein [Clostridia bacterium]
MKTKEWSGRHSQHIVAKIVCFLLAIVFWLYVMYVVAPTYEEEYRDIPVNVIASTVYTGEIDDPYITIRVSGTKQALAKYSAADVLAYVRMATLTETGEGLIDGMTYKMKVQFNLPEGLAVEGEPEVSVRVTEKAVNP